jgi:beta-xylosidase
VLAVWNYAPPEQSGSPRTVTLQLKNTNEKRAYISRVDAEHGDVHHAYEKMGGPRYPTQKEIQELRRAADLPGPETERVDRGEITITLPSHGLAVIELK